MVVLLAGQRLADRGQRGSSLHSACRSSSTGRHSYAPHATAPGCWPPHSAPWTTPRRPPWSELVPTLRARCSQLALEQLTSAGDPESSPAHRPLFIVRSDCNPHGCPTRETCSQRCGVHAPSCIAGTASLRWKRRGWLRERDVVAPPFISFLYPERVLRARQRTGARRYATGANGTRIPQEHWPEVAERAQREGLRTVAGALGASQEAVWAALRSVAQANPGAQPHAWQHRSCDVPERTSTLGSPNGPPKRSPLNTCHSPGARVGRRIRSATPTSTPNPLRSGQRAVWRFDYHRSSDVGTIPGGVLTKRVVKCS